MNATQPEAENEYSTTPPAPDGPARGRGWRRAVAVTLAFSGAALLAATEFVPVLRVRTIAAHPMLVRTVQGGPHHGWALLVLGAVAALVTAAASRSARRLPWALVAIIGLGALLIALLADLPDAHSAGLVTAGAAGVRDAQAHAAVGLYLETLGAIVLLIAAGVGAASPDTTAERETRGRPTARDRGLR